MSAYKSEQDQYARTESKSIPNYDYNSFRAKQNGLSALRSPQVTQRLHEYSSASKQQAQNHRRTTSNT
jgi:hypothetical protein